MKAEEEAKLKVENEEKNEWTFYLDSSALAANEDTAPALLSPKKA